MEEIISFELAQELWKKGFPQIETTCRSYFIGDEDQRYLKSDSIIFKMKREDDEHLIAVTSIDQDTIYLFLSTSSDQTEELNFIGSIR